MYYSSNVGYTSIILYHAGTCIISITTSVANLSCTFFLTFFRKKIKDVTISLFSLEVYPQKPKLVQRFRLIRVITTYVGQKTLIWNSMELMELTVTFSSFTQASLTHLLLIILTHSCLLFILWSKKIDG